MRTPAEVTAGKTKSDFKITPMRTGRKADRDARFVKRAFNAHGNVKVDDAGTILSALIELDTEEEASIEDAPAFADEFIKQNVEKIVKNRRAGLDRLIDDAVKNSFDKLATERELTVPRQNL